jgi:hypothetical protein
METMQHKNEAPQGQKEIGSGGQTDIYKCGNDSL